MQFFSFVKAHMSPSRAVDLPDHTAGMVHFTTSWIYTCAFTSANERSATNCEPFVSTSKRFAVGASAQAGGSALSSLAPVKSSMRAVPSRGRLMRQGTYGL